MPLSFHIRSVDQWSLNLWFWGYIVHFRDFLDYFGHLIDFKVILVILVFSGSILGRFKVVDDILVILVVSSVIWSFKGFKSIFGHFCVLWGNLVILEVARLFLSFWCFRGISKVSGLFWWFYGYFGNFGVMDWYALHFPEIGLRTKINKNKS